MHTFWSFYKDKNPVIKYNNILQIYACSFQPEELNIIPPPPEETYACQQPEKQELHEYKSFVSYTPQGTSQHEEKEPEKSVPKQEPPALDYMFSNGQFDYDEPSRLPSTQSPFVTLLRKGRGRYSRKCYKVKEIEGWKYACLCA